MAKYFVHYFVLYIIVYYISIVLYIIVVKLFFPPLIYSWPIPSHQLGFLQTAINLGDAGAMSHGGVTLSEESAPSCIYEFTDA